MKLVITYKICEEDRWEWVTQSIDAESPEKVIEEYKELKDKFDEKYLPYKQRWEEYMNMRRASWIKGRAKKVDDSEFNRLGNELVQEKKNLNPSFVRLYGVIIDFPINDTIKIQTLDEWWESNKA